MGLFSFSGSKTNVKEVIEPLGIVFSGWQLGRIVGDETKAKRILEIFRATCVDPNSLLQSIIGRGRTQEAASLIKDDQLSLLGERRKVAFSGRQAEFIVGLPVEVTDFLTNQAARPEAELALENGFLPLTVAESYNEKAKFQYVGTLLYEPQVNKKYFLSERKMLSVLPPALIAYYWGKSGDESPLSIEADELLSGSPAQVEEKLKQISVIGLASLRDRHHILSLLHNQGSYKYLSANPADEGLQRNG